MDNQDSDLRLRDYLNVVRKRALLIIGLTVIGAVAGFGLANSQDPMYAGVAEVRILAPNTDAVFDGNQLRIDQRREVDTQSRIIESDQIRARADTQLGPRAADISEVIVNNVADTDIVAIRAESSDAEVARDGANAIATAYVDSRREQVQQELEAQATEFRTQVADLQAQIDDLDAQIAGVDPLTPEAAALTARRNALFARQAEFDQRAEELELEAAVRKGNVELVDEAQLPTDPFDPKPTRAALLGGLLGLLIGVSVAFLREQLSDELTLENVDRITGAPVLGTIPLRSGRRLRRHHLPEDARVIAERDSAVAEAFRTLRTSLRFSNLGRAKTVIAVTSASGSEGKSTVTANLALALAESGLRVVAISADLRRPTLASFFGTEDTDRGLTSVLLGDASLVECLVKVPVPAPGQLALLPSGPIPPNPAELLGSPGAHEVLDKLVGAGADIVLVDCPPVLPVADTLAMSQFVDGAVLVCVPGQTRADGLRRAADRLRQVEAEVIGVVVNGVAPTGSYGGYEYHYGYGPAATTPATSTEAALDLDAVEDRSPAPSS